MVTPLTPGRGQRRVVLQGRPECGGRSGDVLEPARHDADDGVQVVVEPDFAADNRAIGVETPSPQLVAQHDDVRTAEAVVQGREVPPDDRHDAEHLKVVRADALSLEPLGAIHAGDRRPPGPEDRDYLERPRPLAEFAVQREGAIAARSIAVEFQDRHDPIGARIRQRHEEDRIDGAEDGGGTADADREREHGDCREAWRCAQAPRAIPQVGGQRAGDVLPAVRPNLLTNSGDVAHLAPRGPARRVRRQSARESVRDRIVEVLLHFVGDVLVGGVAMDEHPEAASELTPQRHGRLRRLLRPAPPPSIRGRWRRCAASSPPSRRPAASVRRA